MWVLLRAHCGTFHSNSLLCSPVSLNDLTLRISSRNSASPTEEQSKADAHRQVRRRDVHAIMTPVPGDTEATYSQGPSMHRVRPPMETDPGSGSTAAFRIRALFLGETVRVRASAELLRRGLCVAGLHDTSQER